MKKILSFILSLAMLVSLVQVKAETVQSTRDYSAEAIGLMSTLGILNEDEINLYNKNFEISRAAFVRIINRVFKTESISTSSVPYWDVNESNEYYKDIAVAYANGFVGGSMGDAFRPYDIITYNEAIKIVGVMLGYETYAQLSGGWPTGYLAAASKADFAITGVENANSLKFKEAIKIIFKSLNAPMLETDILSGGDYIIDEDNTMLDMRFDIIKTSGVVEANDVTPLVYGDKYISNHIKINGEFYEDAEKEYRSYLGYSVNCYYQKETLKIIYMCKDKNSVIKIDAEDFVSASGTRITYWEDSNKKHVEISSSTTYLYNGKAVNYESEYKKIFTDDFTVGSIECIDNGSDGSFDIVSVTSYKNYVIKSIDEDEKIVYGEYNKGESIDLSENTNWSITDNYGKTYVVEELNVKDSLMVAESFDEEVIQILFCDDIVEGVIQSRDGENNILINNKGYKISKELVDAEEDPIVGEKGVFYLNAYGQIVYYDTVSSLNGNVGLLYRVWEDEGGETLGISVIGKSEKENYNYKLNENLNIDGVNYNNIDKIKAVLNPESGEYIVSVIRYEFNEDGLVNLIDTEALGKNEPEDSSLTKRWTREDSNLGWKSTGRLGNKFMAGDKTALYGIEEVLTGKDDISVYTPGETLGDDASVESDIYTIGSQTINVVAMVTKKSAIGGGGSKAPIGNYFCVFESFSYKYDEEEGEIVGVVSYYDGTAKKNAYINESDKYLIDDLTMGDAFLVKTDLENYILPGIGSNNNIVKIYDYETDTMTTDTDIFTITGDTIRVTGNNKYAISCGKVYEKIDSLFRVGTKNIDYDNLDVKGRDSKLSLRTPYVSYYGGAIYEVERNTLVVTTPSFSNVRDYESFGDLNKTDTVLAQTEYAHDRRNCYFRH